MLLRLSRRLAPWVLGCVVGPQAAALGFDAPPGSVALGLPLDFAIPVRVDRGEKVDAGCVRADVRIGERRIGAAELAVSVEPAGGGAKIRLRSRSTVSEPLVTIDIAMDCGSPIERSFVVLADPPRARVDDRPEPSGAGAEGARPPRPGAASSPPARGSAPRETSPRLRVPSMGGAAGEEPAPAGVVSAPSAVGVRPEPQAPATPPASAARPADAAGRAGGDGSTPAASERLQLLEREVEALRMQNRAQQQTIDRLRRSRSPDDDPRFEAAGGWLPLGALALLSTWLGVRLHVARRASRPAAGSGTALSSETSETASRSLTAVPRPSVREPGPDGPELPLLAASDRSTVRRDSPFAIDELIDLDQQVDFFVVLGEEDAAAAMLEAQLETPVGDSPLAWLRLLALHRRRADEEGYRRLGERFTRRFGVEPPPWERGPESGRGLAGCTPLIEELQLAWPKPAVAMRLLELVLWRRSGTPWLDLPALRDALLLYAVARDLHRREETETPQVDLWLPLHAAPESAAQAPRR